MAHTQNKHTPKKRSDPRELSRFIEEFSWLLKSFEGLDYGALSDFSHEMEFFLANSQRLRNNGRDGRKTTVLVGILPNFLMDNSLFPSNEGIVEFSDAALGLPINRWQKKSRYEIIGQIVCHTNEASPKKVRILSELIEAMQDNKTNIRKAIEINRERGHSWSEVIGRLYDEF